MFSLLPTPLDASDPPARLAINEKALLELNDPWDRARAAEDEAKRLMTLVSVILRVRSEAVLELIHRHKTPPSRVARHLGISKQRVGQLVNKYSAVAGGGDVR
jgi:hypothetical protein